MAGRAKKAAHDKRMKEKRAKKSQKAAEYAAKRGTKKTVKKGIRQFSIGKHKHLIAKCGNQGCLRCFPRLNLSYYAHRIMRRIGETK